MLAIAALVILPGLLALVLRTVTRDGEKYVAARKLAAGMKAGK